ncbi:hypothetical protein [Lysinibacillus fusiformis]|uniref:hypothetical protein n=1 Tax=Lysinibacillus fusiformis TaxID=28031 RepID=UPI00187FA941|nr:hypothetical protein [Lysinibacillus fusiformis]MBD8523983.1 hypothetical protein [Lysinibacillus fusiformis]MCR8854814.1 hypothetical protein [Lysinibacillus fusiformis]WKT77204.1 hypothetical protein QYY55_25010 [Lysinibacillus fusiformis]
MSNTTEYSIMVDPQSFSTKEQALKCAGLVKVRIMNHPVTATLPEIMTYIMRGQTVILGELGLSDKHLKAIAKGEKIRPTASKGTWKSQQIFAIDIDNEYKVRNKETGKFDKVKYEGELYLEIQDILDICSSREIYPSVIYETLSSEKNHRKYRVFFVVDNLVTNESLRERLTMSLVESFFYKGYKLSDTSCTDAARLFFGGKQIVYENYDVVNSIKHLLDVPITYKAAVRSKGPAAERKDQIRNAAKKSTNQMVKLIANHDWDEIKNIVAERIQTAFSPTATRHEGSLTKLETFISLVHRLTNNIYITKDIMFPFWLDELKPMVIRGRRDFYHSASVFPMEILFGCEAYESISCILPDHEDKNPSARFEYTSEGKSKYKCYACCEDYSLDIFDLFEALSGLSSTSVRHHIAYIFNLTLETEWQKEKRRELDDFAEMYRYADKRIAAFAPRLYKRLRTSRLLLLLEMMMLDAKIYLPDISITSQEEAIYIAEVRNISKWMQDRAVAGSSVKTIHKKMHLAATLGLIEYLPENSDVLFVHEARARKRDKIRFKGLLHQYRTNIIRIPILTKRVFLDAEKRLKDLEDKNFSFSHADKRETYVWGTSEEEASTHYVQDTKENKKSTETMKAFERFKAAAEDLLERQGYFTQKDLLSHKRIRQLKKKKELLAIVTPELLKTSEIEYTYYRSHYKDLYKIKQGKLQELKPGRTKIYRRLEIEDKDKSK